jgi:hypothetical protein
VAIFLNSKVFKMRRGNDSGSSVESLSLSDEESSDIDGYLDCGLPVDPDRADGHCRGCFASFPADVEDRLTQAWRDTAESLNRNGFHGAVPTMDRHFERVFFLFVMDWIGRVDEVGFMYDSDAEYVPFPTSEDEESYEEVS